MSVEAPVRYVLTPQSAEKGVQNEIEPIRRNPIVFLGATSGSGRVMAEQLALDGHPLIAGGRNAARFEELRQSIIEKGGLEPRPFLADITKLEDVEKLVDSMGLAEGETVDFYPFAAAGFETIARNEVFLSTINSLKKKARRGEEITREEAEAGKLALKEELTKPEVMELAELTNHIAPIALATELVKRGHINKDSLIVYSSSSISDYTNPDGPEGYPGPWSYFPVGISKARAERDLREIAEETGAEFINEVSPGLGGTGVGNLFAGLETTFTEVAKAVGEEYIAPKISKEGAVAAMRREMQENTAHFPRIRTVYITRENNYQYDKPDSFAPVRIL